MVYWVYGLECLSIGMEEELRIFFDLNPENGLIKKLFNEIVYMANKYYPHRGV